MKNAVLALIGAISIPLFLNAQNWYRTYDLVPGGYSPNSDIGSTLILADGNLAMVSGTLCENNSIDCFGLYSLNQNNGDVIWKKHFFQYPESLRPSGRNVLVTTKDNHLLFVGDQWVGTGEEWRVFLMKLTQEGDTLWTRTFDSPLIDFARTVTELPDGNYLIHSDGYLPNTGGITDIFLIKTDTSGNLIWQKNLNINSNQWRGAEKGNLTLLPDGGMAIVFYAKKYPLLPPYYNLMLAKLDADGNLLWIKETYPIDMIYPSIAALPDGGMATVSIVDTFMPPLYYSKVMFVTKFDSEGEIEWEVSFPDHRRIFPNSLRLTAEGDILVCGDQIKYSSPTKAIAWLAKINKDGTLAWKRTYELADHPWSFFRFSDVVELNDGSLAACGYLQDTLADGTKDANAWVIRFDSNGCYGPQNCDSTNIILNTLQLEPPSLQGALAISPNPSDDVVTFTIIGNWPQPTFKIADLTGRIVHQSQPLVQSFETWTPPSPGVYFATLFSGNTPVVTKKLVVH